MVTIPRVVWNRIPLADGRDDRKTRRTLVARCCDVEMPYVTVSMMPAPKTIVHADKNVFHLGFFDPESPTATIQRAKRPQATRKCSTKNWISMLNKQFKKTFPSLFLS